jgi:hypothetical protein
MVFYRMTNLAFAAAKYKIYFSIESIFKFNF